MPASDKLLNQIKDDVSELRRTGRKVVREEYLEEKGYHRLSDDPAAIFADYESFKRGDGTTDVEALLYSE